MANTIDLHMHTTASDGCDCPAQLLENLRQAGITTFSVTDHDTIDGLMEMEKLVTDEFRFLRGVEFSCESPRGKSHILGYGFDPQAPEFRAALDEARNVRLEKREVRIRYLLEVLKLPLTEEELTWLRSLESAGKPHVGQLVMNHGLADDIQTAIRTYINPCKVPRDRIDASLAIQAIRAAGGIPVWAHPLGGEGEKRLTREKFADQLQELMGYGIRGLECHYSRYDPEDVEFLVAQAKAHDLLISGGSDYHGANKPGLPLGRLNTRDADISPKELTILDHL